MKQRHEIRRKDTKDIIKGEKTSEENNNQKPVKHTKRMPSVAIIVSRIHVLRALYYSIDYSPVQK